MDFARLEAVALQALVEIPHRGLAVAEDHCAGDVFRLQHVAQRIALLARIDLHQPLGDVGGGRCRARHFDRLGVGQEFVGQFLDDRRHGRGEEQGLPLRGQLGADFLDIRDEAHVEHAVGFVDDQHRTAIEQNLAATEQVHQAARRRDQHVDALFQRLELIAHLHAADQQRHVELMIFAVFLEIFGHLRRQFAGRLQDQRARHQRAGAAMGENVDHRQHEAGRLARARLGDADNVPHHEDGRNCLRLDRRRCVVTGFGYGLEQFVGKAEIGKSHSIVRDRRLIRPARMRDGNPPRIAKILATCQENRANERLWRTISHLHRPG